ncbi:MAG TPA: hypothetical protein HPP58_09495 [Deltaproteobacteria bacterium]|nr:hypothetical protein [Deltaproteobacteria bacterium]HIJ41902.1 hypothetical protein [Deltaproteobacteria bacterium]
MMQCAFCKKGFSMKDKVMRHDTCPHCGWDIRCCRQCKFHDYGAYNECQEVMAERVIEKERANFCEYFVLRGSAPAGTSKQEDAKKALEDLFRK